MWDLVASNGVITDWNPLASPPNALLLLRVKGKTTVVGTHTKNVKGLS